MSSGPIVIVGGGHAAAQLCGSLAEAGQGARVQLVSQELEPPYQRPPLSKSFLKAPTETLAPLRTAAWYAEAGIQLQLGDAAVAIDREQRQLRLASGRALPYEQLVLATGAQARRLAALPDGLRNVLALRSSADAMALRERLAGSRRLTVLGGGFIGLEVAATARGLGLEVEVLESLPRLLARSVSAVIAERVQAHHRDLGVRLRLGVSVGDFEVDGDRLVALRVDGERQEVELLLLGIGATPQTALAQQAGLTVDNGIVVDALLRSSDPAILAIGDCAQFPEAGSGRRLRHESVQNANDQAKCAAATLLGRGQPYAALPWFWSDQGSLRLQMTGLLPPDTHAVVRPGAAVDSFSVLHYAGGRFVCIESVNVPADHLIGRKLLEAGKSPPIDQVVLPNVPMKGFLQA